LLLLLLLPSITVAVAAAALHHQQLQPTDQIQIDFVMAFGLFFS